MPSAAAEGKGRADCAYNSEDFVNCVCRSVAHIMMGVATALQAISLLLFRALSYTSRRIRWA
jgi:hypothetical protein